MPQKPRTSKKDPGGTVIIYTRLPTELHGRALRLAQGDATSMAQWIKVAVQEKAARDERRQP